MMRTFSDGGNVYSVDMMFAYVNEFKPETTKMPVESLGHVLEYKSWGEPGGKKHSPADVAKAFAKEKYKEKYKENGKYGEDIERIKNADLKYPIMVILSSDERIRANEATVVVDGVHRLAKAAGFGGMPRKKMIKAYVFDLKLMRRFFLAKKGIGKNCWEKIDRLETHDICSLFFERFAAAAKK
jgi:hypothetical protein